MIITRRLWTMAMLVFLLGGLVSCQEAPKETPSAAIQISGAGATFPAPLYKKWIEEYQKANKDVAVSYQGVGSGEGIKKFVNNEVDFGASDAAMTDEQMAKVDRGAKLVPATAGIVVLAYNLKEVTAPLKLPRDVYVDIFWGKIKKWNDPRLQKANPGAKLPDKEILLVVRQDSSGTTFAFTNHLSAVSDDWRDKGPGVGKLLEWPRNKMVAPRQRRCGGKNQDQRRFHRVHGIRLRRSGRPGAWQYWRTSPAISSSHPHSTAGLPWTTPLRKCRRTSGCSCQIPMEKRRIRS